MSAYSEFDVAPVATPQRLAALERLIATLRLAPEPYTDEIEALELATASLKQQDESDRALGQAIRRNRSLSNQQSTTDAWMALAKTQAGFDSSVPFDQVWKVVLERAGLADGASRATGATPVDPVAPPTF